MIVTLHTQGLQTLVQVRVFVAGSEAVIFTIADRSTACAWMADTLKLFHYESKPEIQVYQVVRFHCRYCQLVLLFQNQ